MYKITYSKFNIVILTLHNSICNVHQDNELIKFLKLM